MRRKAAIYARYSEGEGRDKSTTIDNQIAMCKEKALKEGLSVVDEHVYVDQKVSASSVNTRPGLMEMLNNIIDQNIDFPDVLIAKDHSRLFRNYQDANNYTEVISQAKVSIIYVTQDFGSPDENNEDWFLSKQVMIFSEYQRRHMARITYEHMKQNAQAGFWTGGIAPVGYMTVDAGISGKTKRN